MNAPSSTDHLFATADRTLLTPYGLDPSSLDQVFGRILAHRVDYADLYFQYSRNESWSMDFMADQLFDGRRFRLLTIVDNFSRESLAIRAGQRLNGDDVVVALEKVVTLRGAPKSIRVDNGPEFVSKSLDWWAYFNGVELDFSRPGKPTDNAFIESFNGKFRQECLNQHWFLSLEDAQERIDLWREHYNEDRPHTALKGRTPHEFAIFSGQEIPGRKNLIPSIPLGTKIG